MAAYKIVVSPFYFRATLGVKEELQFDINIEIFLCQMDKQMIIFERKICVVAGALTN